MSNPAFIAAGNNLNNHISFNSGTLDFGNSRIVQIENITLTIGWTLSDLFVLNSIKPIFKARHTQKISLTGQIKSFSPTFEMLALGSSYIGSPNGALTLDGQATQTNPVVTFYDSSNNEVQYQLSGVVIKSTKLSAKMEDYTTWDFELEAMDVSEVIAAI
jgi:hypothetical protein